MKIIFNFLVVITLSSCVTPSSYYQHKEMLSDHWSVCVDTEGNTGICVYYKTNYNSDFSGSKTDTIDYWSMTLPNLQKLKYNENWIIAKSSKRYFITENAESPDFIKKYSSKKYLKFYDKLVELNIPDSLHISK